MTTGVTDTGTVERRPPLRATRLLFGRRTDVRDELEELDIRRSVLGSVPLVILAGLLLVALGGSVAAVLAGRMTTELAVSFGATGIAVGGLLVAVLQWRLGLAEKAFDALYGRIGLANEMRLKAFEGVDRHDEEAAATTHEERYRFFVYTEIDSLEYAVRRYQFGLGMTADITARAVGHFESRCRNEAFRAHALSCAADGAYFEATKDLVGHIVRRVAAEEEAAGRTNR